VKADDDSLRQVGRWPWPRPRFAQLTDELTKAGANRIFFDVSFFGPTNGSDDLQFAAALKRSGRVVIAANTRAGTRSGESEADTTLPVLAAAAQLGSISWRYNYRNAVIEVPYAAKTANSVIPSFSVLLSGRPPRLNGSFTPDYSLDPESIPSISAAQVLRGNFNPARVRGKDVVIGGTSHIMGDEIFIPGTGRMAGVYAQIIAAETLKSGRPINAGWFPLFFVALAASGLVLRLRTSAHQGAMLGSCAVAIFVGATVAESHLLYLDVTPGLFVLLVVGFVLGWRRYRTRGLVNPMSNLPNLNSLRQYKQGRDQALVGARILNYEEIVASLPSDQERQLVDQIAARLNVGSPDRILFQGDGGIFAWF